MKHWKNILISLLVVSLCCMFFENESARSASTLYTITFIDVGQGDSALLQDPNGYTVLIDGGKTTAGPTVVNFIRSQGVTKIDVLLETHPDSDHLGGLLDVLAMTDVPVLSVVYNGYPGTTQLWTDFTTAVAAEGLALTTLQYPQITTWGSMQVQVVNPAGGLVSPDTNAACLVVKVGTGSIQTLFACDLDSAQESVILTRPLNLNSDILKVAHHGSDLSSSTAFLNAVTPSVAVISVGDNSYGHPGAATLARLDTVGAAVWRTDLDGNITILTDGTRYTVNAPFNILDQKVFLPLVTNNTGTVLPGNVVITNIFYDGVLVNEPDEFVEIQNQGGSSVQLQNWTLRDIAAHIYTFPSFSISPGQTCRVYTNITDFATCGFTYNSGTSIWNNSGDCAYLKDSTGVAVDEYCY